MRLDRLVPFVLAALVLGGCTSTAKGHSSRPSESVSTTPSSPGTVSVFPTPSSSISATSTAAPWTKVVALGHATTITKGASDALATLSGVSANATLTMAHRAVNAIADADDAAVHALAGGAWPTQVRVQVNAYIAALDTESRAMRSLAGQPTVAAMQQHATTIGALLAEVSAAGKTLVDALR